MDTKKVKGPNDGIIEAQEIKIIENPTIFDVLRCFMKHYGHNIKSVSLKGSQKVKINDGRIIEENGQQNLLSSLFLC